MAYQQPLAEEELGGFDSTSNPIVGDLRNYFWEYLRGDVLEGLSGSSSEYDYNLYAQDYLDWWDEYGEIISGYAYDPTKEMLSVRGRGAAYKPLRTAAESEMKSTISAIGRLGFGGRGYAGGMTGDTVSKLEEEVTSTAYNRRTGIRNLWDQWYETDILGSLIPSLSELGAFDPGIYTRSDKFDSDIDTDDAIIPGGGTGDDEEGWSLGDEFFCLTSPQCCTDGVPDPDLCEEVGEDDDDDGGPVGFNTSDIRLKKNITKVGKSPLGINIYEFDYIYKPGRYKGVMAQEVPNASVKGEHGYYMVDYSKIDVNFERIV